MGESVSSPRFRSEILPKWTYFRAATCRVIMHQHSWASSATGRCKTRKLWQATSEIHSVANKIAMKGRFEMYGPEWVRLVRKVSTTTEAGFLCVKPLAFRLPGALCIPQRYVKHCLVVNSANVPLEGSCHLKKGSLKIEKASNLGNTGNYASSHLFEGGKKLAVKSRWGLAIYIRLGWFCQTILSHHLPHNDQHSMRCICTALWQSIPTAILSFGTVRMAAFLPWQCWTCWTVPRRPWSECATRIQNRSMPMHANGWFRLSSWCHPTLADVMKLSHACRLSHAKARHISSRVSLNTPWVSLASQIAGTMSHALWLDGISMNFASPNCLNLSVFQSDLSQSKVSYRVNAKNHVALAMGIYAAGWCNAWSPMESDWIRC